MYMVAWEHILGIYIHVVVRNRPENKREPPKNLARGERFCAGSQVRRFVGSPASRGGWVGLVVGAPGHTKRRCVTRVSALRVSEVRNAYWIVLREVLLAWNNIGRVREVET